MAVGSQSFDDELVRLFELSPDAFCIAGFDGYFKRANPAFARNLGYTLQQLLARPFLEHIHPEDRESVEGLIAEVGAGNPVVGFECRHICADGSARWFEWSTSSRPESGVVYGVGRDVTERRIANDELSALRHIATLAAEGVAPADLFAAVAEEAARVVGAPICDRGALRARQHTRRVRDLSQKVEATSRGHPLCTGRHDAQRAGAGRTHRGAHRRPFAAGR